MTLIRICAWCMRFYGLKDGQKDIPGYDVTHGMCAKCADEMKENRNKRLANGQSFK